MADLTKIAAVLDAAADYIEEREREKVSAVAAQRQARIDKIATAHLAAHGEELPALVRQKLAATDDGSLDIVEDLLSKQAGTITPLGAGDAADGPVLTNIKEAANAADERFLGWIVS